MEHPHAVPIAPDNSLLKEFSNHFKSPEEIQKMAKSKTSIPLLPQDQVLTLKGVQHGRKKVAIGGAYEHMNANLRYLNEIPLLHSTYNHYVHYYMTELFKKEAKEYGKHQKEQEKAAIQLSRKR
ncbi:hypothetical protein O181_049154 [Austropuccinia psidii MF-1]|uniref:Uncharacterized protein n=1 Tax=Austropuccinia psidii MF-1 TaxID=1389203 RepID=A0A9Q3HNJ6_9BASI|nr:hypothetical protein [Austropuccinia psidii MF-1]